MPQLDFIKKLQRIEKVKSIGVQTERERGRGKTDGNREGAKAAIMHQSFSSKSMNKCIHQTKV